MYNVRYVSPSRRYVAITEHKLKNGTSFLKFVKFTIPEQLENTRDNAQFWYVNRLNLTDVIYDVITLEEYTNKVKENNVY